MASRQMPTVLSESESGDEPDEPDSPSSGSAEDRSDAVDTITWGVPLPGFPRLLPAPQPLRKPRPPTSKPLGQLLPLKPGLVARAVKLEDGTLFSFTPAVSAPSGEPVGMVQDVAAEAAAMAPLQPRSATSVDPATAEAAVPVDIDAAEGSEVAATLDAAPPPAAVDADITLQPDVQLAKADLAEQPPLDELAGLRSAYAAEAAADTVPADRNTQDPAMPSAAAAGEAAPLEPPTTDAAAPVAVDAETMQEAAGDAGGEPVRGGVPVADAGAAEAAAQGEAMQVEDYFTDVAHLDDGGAAAEDSFPDAAVAPGVEVRSEDVSAADSSGAAVSSVVGPADEGSPGGEVVAAPPHELVDGGTAAAAAAGAADAASVAGEPAAGAMGAPAADATGAGVASQADGRAAAAQFMRARSDADAPADGVDVKAEGTDGVDAAGGAAIVAYGDAAGGSGGGGGESMAIVRDAGSVAGTDELPEQDVPPLPSGVREDRPTDVSTALAARAVSGAYATQSLVRRRGAAPVAAEVPPRLVDAAEAAAASAAAVYANAKPRTDSPFVTAGSMDEADGGPRREPPPETIIHPFHLTLFAILLVGGVGFAITVINFTTDMGWVWSSVRVLRKLAKSLAFRQTIALLVAIAFVRYSLEPLVRSVRSVFALPGQWERSNEYFILKQVRPPPRAGPATRYGTRGRCFAASHEQHRDGSALN